MRTKGFTKKANTKKASDAASVSRNAVDDVIQPVEAPAKGLRSEKPAKRGRASWLRHDLIDVHNKEEGFRYRAVSKESRNIARKLQQGWEFVGKNEAAGTYNVQANKITQGTDLSTVNEGPDWVLMRLPEELARERDEAINAETDRRTRAIKREAEHDLKKSDPRASVHGKVELQKYATVIE